MPKLKSSWPRLVSEEEVQLQAERLRHLGPTVDWEAGPRKKGWRFMRIEQVILHFWERVNTDEDCWVWSASRNKKGYGVLGFRNITILAHRLSYILCHGQIPRDLFVLHKCDNAPCVNPDHLFLGTVQDNSDDMVAKGRQQKGESHKIAKLSEAQVLEIVRRYKNETPGKSLAKEFGMSRTAISEIVNGHRWAWLTKIVASCPRPAR